MAKPKKTNPMRDYQPQDLEKLMEDYVSKLEKKVALETQNLYMLADAMPQIVWMAGPDGRPDYYNRRWYDYTGFSADESQELGDWRQIVHPKDLETVVISWYEAINKNEPYELEFRLRNQETGRYRWFLGRAICGQDHSGNAIRWFGTATDIHEYKKSQRQKDEFIAVASHELKTPVTSIKIFAQIIQKHLESSNNPKTLRPLQKMNEQITRLSGLVDDLLDIARLDTGKLELRRERFEIDELIRETAESLNLISDDHRVLVRGKTGIKVLADKHRVEQVLVNLVTNAIKYSPRGGDVIIRTKNTDEGVVTSVKDSGIGIPKEQQPLVFSRFFSVDDPKKKRDSTGLGLGLHISSEIVQRQGGRIWVDSRVGEGSTFYFSLPKDEA